MSEVSSDSLRLVELDFARIGPIEPERDDAGALRVAAPQSRYSNLRALPLNRYGAGPFCKFKIPSGLKQAGVYVITIDGQSRYVQQPTQRQYPCFLPFVHVCMQTCLVVIVSLKVFNQH